MDKTYIPNKMHTIAIDDNNYQTLRRLGSFGDSFNDILTSLMTIAKRKTEDRQDDRS
jgi:predicted CopG family antitoxin